MVTRTRDVLELTNGELCVLRWLRISNGKATLSASAFAKNSLFIVPRRLLQAGYVRVGIDQTSPLEALELNESKTYFADLAKRRRSRAGVAKGFSAPKRPRIQTDRTP